jgi:hypothetical protein
LELPAPASNAISTTIQSGQWRWQSQNPDGRRPPPRWVAISWLRQRLGNAPRAAAIRHTPQLEGCGGAKIGCQSVVFELRKCCLIFPDVAARCVCEFHRAPLCKWCQDAIIKV